MSKLTLNISNDQPDLVPDGIYEGVIKSLVVRPKKDDSKVHLCSVLVGINDDGEYQGRTMFRNFPYSLTDKDVHWLVADFKLLGVESDEEGDFDFEYDSEDPEKPQGPWPVTSPDLEGEQCWIQVITTEFEGKKTNKFSKFVPEPEGSRIS